MHSYFAHLQSNVWSCTCFLDDVDLQTVQYISVRLFVSFPPTVSNTGYVIIHLPFSVTSRYPINTHYTFRLIYILLMSVSSHSVPYGLRHFPMPFKTQTSHFRCTRMSCCVSSHDKQSFRTACTRSEQVTWDQILNFRAS